MTDPDAVRRRCGPAGPGWCGWKLRPIRCGSITDIAATCAIAHAAGARGGGRFHRRHAGLDAPARTWRRHRHAFGHQVSQRSFRPDCRRAHNQGGRLPMAAHPDRALANRRRAGIVRRVAADPRHAHAVPARAHRMRERAGHRRALCAPSADTARCSTPGCRRSRATPSPRRKCAAASAACCRCALAT